MANRLLDKAGLERAKLSGAVPHHPAHRVYRAALYHAEHGTRVFEGRSAVEAAMGDGWSDEPVEPIVDLSTSQLAPDGLVQDLERKVEALKGALVLRDEEIASLRQQLADVRLPRPPEVKLPPPAKVPPSPATKPKPRGKPKPKTKPKGPFDAPGNR